MVKKSFGTDDSGLSIKQIQRRVGRPLSRSEKISLRKSIERKKAQAISKPIEVKVEQKTSQGGSTFSKEAYKKSLEAQGIKVLKFIQATPTEIHAVIQPPGAQQWESITVVAKSPNPSEEGIATGGSARLLGIDENLGRKAEQWATLGRGDIARRIDADLDQQVTNLMKRASADVSKGLKEIRLGRTGEAFGPPSPRREKIEYTKEIGKFNIGTISGNLPSEKETSIRAIERYGPPSPKPQIGLKEFNIGTMSGLLPGKEWDANKELNANLKNLSPEITNTRQFKTTIEEEMSRQRDIYMYGYDEDIRELKAVKDLDFYETLFEKPAREAKFYLESDRYSNNIKGELLKGIEPLSSAALGIFESATSQARFLNTAARHPIKTAKAFKEVPELVTSGDLSRSAKNFVSKNDPFFVAGYIIAEYYGTEGIGKLSSKALDLTISGAVRLSTKYAPAIKDVFGIKTITYGSEYGGIKQIDIVPPGSRPKLRTEPSEALRQFEKTVTLKEEPSLPKVTKVQKEILKAAIETESPVFGGLGRSTFIGGGFEDIDLASRNVQRTVSVIEKRIGKQSLKVVEKEINKVPVVSIYQKSTGKKLVDVVPIERVEEGLGITRPTRRLDKTLGRLSELEFISVETGLAGKTGALGKGKLTKDAIKAMKGLEQLSGGKIKLSQQAVRGGFGYSFKEQAEFVGKTGDIITAQRNLFGKILRREIKVNKPKLPTDPELERSLFATQWDIRTGKSQLRISRLTLKSETASLKELFTGKVSWKPTKPQAVIFENAEISNLNPKLRKLLKKAEKGGNNDMEAFFKEYVKFQQIPEGKFKPFGFRGSEMEVSLPPGEIVRKTKTLGYTVLEGKVVPIIGAKVVEPSKKLAKLAKKLENTGLTKVEKDIFEKAIKKETGFKSAEKLEISKEGKYLRKEKSGRVENLPEVSPVRTASTISSLARSRKKIERISSAIGRVSKESSKAKSRKASSAISRLSKVKSIPRISKGKIISEISKPKKSKEGKGYGSQISTTPIIKTFEQGKLKKIPNEDLYKLISIEEPKIKKKKKKQRVRQGSIGYVPGFTARITGISITPSKSDLKELEKLTKLPKSGLEIRPLVSGKSIGLQKIKTFGRSR